MEVEVFKKYNDAFLSTSRINVRIKKSGLRFSLFFQMIRISDYKKFSSSSDKLYYELITSLKRITSELGCRTWVALNMLDDFLSTLE